MATVVLAEDQPAWRQLLARQLRDHGHQVTEIADGDALLTLVDRLLHDPDAELPDVLVSDVRMPGASGLAALQRLRHDDDLTHVVLMTAFPDSETVLYARRLGATEVLDKPFEPAQLLSLIARLTG